MVARIPRKKGQPAKSKKHSDLYTDEDPKGTIHGLKFTTVADAQRSVRKIKNSRRCLLYASPSPRDGLLSRMPSSA